MKSRIGSLAARLDVWLVGAVVLGAALRFSRLGDFDNPYYTATVVSMLKSATNFLFASFDPGGVVTVDKPPVSFWIQAIPVALFGPSRWAVSLPQAIAGVLAILILYLALKPAFGRVAAVAGAFLLAVIPASVLIDSRNEPDSLLSFTLLLAAVSIVLAAKTGKWRWLMLFAVLMGVAFNIKMLAAFVPLPAFLLYYLVASRQSFRWLGIRAASALAVLLLISFSWVCVVAFTPADQRPYVGSTRDNSIWTLVFKYNGMDRFTSFIGARPRQALAPLPGASPPPGSTQPQLSPPMDTGLQGLFTQRLAGQTGWLLPLGLFMLMAALVPLLSEKVYRRPAVLFEVLRETPISQTILWGGWFATAVVVFGLADSTTTHPYYLAALAVPLAAVSGIGFGILWHAFRMGDASSWLLPAALVGGALYQVLAARTVAADWATAVALVAATVAALGTVIAAARKVTATPLASAFAILGALVLLVIPATVAIGAGGPIAGPNAALVQTPAPPRVDPEKERVEKVSSFIDRHGDGGSVFAIATVNAREAAPFIIAGVPAVAIGGFSGGDPIFTTESFRAVVKRGEVRYFLMPGPQAPGGPGGLGPQEAILSEIRRAWEDVSVPARLPPGSLYRSRE